MEKLSTLSNLAYDGAITISVGEGARSKLWLRKDLTWSQFVDRLRIPQVTAETREEYFAGDSAFKSKCKDRGGYIGGTLAGTSRGKNDVVSRRLLAFDLDDAEAPGFIWQTFCLTYGCAGVMHSTHSSTPDKPRLRLIAPLKYDLPPAKYAAVSKRIAESIGLAQFDKSTHEANRLMFWPTISKGTDTDYLFEVNDEPWLDPTEILNTIKTEEFEELMSRNDPGLLPGTIGEFCKAYNIPAAIDAFLSEVYVKTSDGRYKLIGTNSVGGFIVYDGDNWCYSHHSNHDPAYGKTLHSFDLVRIHKFGALDEGLAADVLYTNLNSYKAMLDWITENKLCNVQAWKDNMAVNAKGRPAATISNVQAVLMNDPAIKDSFIYDEFADKLMVYNDFPWLGLMDRTTMQWSDADDAGLSQYLEDAFGICDNGKQMGALLLAKAHKKYHPVREYIKATTWDEQNRLDTLAIKFLGAEDNTYVRAVTRKALIGAIARVFEPGCKHDHVLVFVGPQGCRKSTTIGKLGGKWYTDSLYSMQGKEAYELLQGYWLVEIPEMAAAKKSEVESIKQFISKQSDNFRAAYARNTVDHPRQCAFFGSTNDNEFLRDATGNRRFWPVTVKKVDDATYAELTDDYISQLWAEAYQAYISGEKWYLDSAMEEQAQVEQEKHYAGDNRRGLVEEFLETEVPENWNKMNSHERLMHYQTITTPFTGGIKRDRICALELWIELFNGQVKDFNMSRAVEINNIMRKIKGWQLKNVIRTGAYGAQRGFIRVK